MKFSEDYAIKPPEGLTEEEWELCKLVHKYSGLHKYALFLAVYEEFGWDREKFTRIYKILIEKQAIVAGEQ